MEQEFSCEGNSGIHERFAGKERAVQDPEDAGEYLFIEEIPASTPRRPMHRMRRDQVKDSLGNNCEKLEPPLLTCNSFDCYEFKQ